ncbi:MAG: redox-regulated ATPase YchF [Ruminococcaceae bacterium]|nr:redox-regulated ATPase YchF [Oscillospiraceae bacterium]
MKLGIVGLPNVGKTCLFNAMTGQKADTSNYLFGTVGSNIGMVSVPDTRLDWLADHYQPKKKTPATIDFVDIAGLVRGASKGEGLGNKFLSNIRQVDALVHVVRCFDDENVAHADGSVDPARDIETINLELILSDMDIVERRRDRAVKNSKGDKKYLAEADLCQRLLDHLEMGQSARSFEFTDDEAELIKTSELLTLLPVIYVANLGEDAVSDPEGSEYYKIVKEAAEAEGAPCLPICALFEADIVELEEEDRQMFLEDMGITETGLDKLIRASYALMGLISFLTAGTDECRAWTIRKGSKAPKAAGKIHSDLERGFIRAETVAFEDLKEAGNLNAAKTKGLLRSEGKEYVVQDGDVINILFNV